MARTESGKCLKTVKRIECKAKMEDFTNSMIEVEPAVVMITEVKLPLLPFAITFI